MTRIVTYVHRYKRLTRKKTSVALKVPAIVATKKNRRPAERAAAEVVSRSPRCDDGVAQPSTRRDAERDYAVTAPPSANDGRKSAIVTTTSRKRLKLLRAERPAERDDDPEKAAEIRARFERAKWGHGPAR